MDPSEIKGAIVGVRFADGAPAVLRTTTDLSGHGVRVGQIIYMEPDAFIDMLLRTRGIGETWLRGAAGQ